MNLFKNILKITVVITFLFLVGCKKEQNKEQNESSVNTLTDEIDKVVTIYQDGDVKIETIADPGFQKIETSAPESYKDKVRQELEKSYSKQTTYLKSAGNTVGVIKSGTCGSYKELYVYMDCEDSNNKTRIDGKWIGDIDVFGGNVALHFCVITGAYFQPTNHDYAVLNLSTNSVPNGVYRVVRTFDNEDSRNQNSATLNGAPVKYLYGDCNFYYDTQLSFYYYPAVSSATPFPNLGFLYGVFGNWGSIDDKGSLFVDDEDGNNGNILVQQKWQNNQLQPEEKTSGIPSVIMTDGENSVLYINKAI
jgi:hypothetical protein